MKKIPTKWNIWIMICVVVVFLGCTMAQENQKSSVAEKPQPAGVLQLAEIEPPAVYQQPVLPLTTLQCAQCHFDVFKDIRDQGG